MSIRLGYQVASDKLDDWGGSVSATVESKLKTSEIGRPHPGLDGDAVGYPLVIHRQQTLIDPFLQRVLFFQFFP